MPLDPKAVEMLAARAAVLPRTGTVPAQAMRDLHKALSARQGSPRFQCNK
jgi:acetyl esterase